MTRRWILFTACISAASRLFSKTLIALAPAPYATLALEVEKTGIMAGKKHRFVFTSYHGEILDNQQVNFTVRSASIRCEDTWVSDKDRLKILNYARNEMLQADQYPEIHYASTAVRANGENNYAINGNLTIGRKTRPVSINAARAVDSAGKPWWNGSGIISLADFGLKPPTAAMGTIGTKDKMQLSFHLAAQ